YWDTSDRRLARAGCTLRVREQAAGRPPTGDGQLADEPKGPGWGGPGEHASARKGELTLKGPSSHQDGRGRAAPVSWSRTELTAEAPAGSGPQEWARTPAAAVIVAALRRLDAAEGLRPDVVLLNPRRELVLRKDADEAVLSLDEVCIEDQPYCRRYVEIELKRGAHATLETLAQSIAAQFRLRPSRRGKVQAARAWLTGRGT
ncbi:MAG: CYTH domain-containing protein, partial [Chloroflexota bacterium]